MVEKALPRPAPEQPDKVQQLANKLSGIQDLLQRRKPIYDQFAMTDIAGQLVRGHLSLQGELRHELVREAQEFVVFDGRSAIKTDLPPKERTPEALLARARKEVKKEKQRKSRGLKDPRPVRFAWAGMSFRGKEGNFLSHLNKPVVRPQSELIVNIFPGVEKSKARKRLGRVVSSLRAKGLDITVRYDRAEKETFYTWSNRTVTKKKK